MTQTHNVKVFKRWLPPALEFKWQDMWIGGYHEWKTVVSSDHAKIEKLHIWICILPMFPIHLQRLVEKYNYGIFGLK